MGDCCGICPGDQVAPVAGGVGVVSNLKVVPPGVFRLLGGFM
jgi:hypothetical protein